MFGWLKGDGMDMGPWAPTSLFTIGGAAVGAMSNSRQQKRPDSGCTTSNVGDIDAAAKRVGDGGGKIMHGPQQVPGGGWIVQAADPQGAAFALVGSRK